MGTSKNSPYRSRATRLPSNDSALFLFRFVDVHSRAARDWQRNQFFEVPLFHSIALSANSLHRALQIFPYRVWSRRCDAAPAREAAPLRHLTRQSTEHNLDLEFNSLDAQREVCEAYIKSQAHEGWRLVRTRYDDGGLSGASLDRPALHGLLDDVRNGKIDVIVVYKVDRANQFKVFWRD